MLKAKIHKQIKEKKYNNFQNKLFQKKVCEWENGKTTQWTETTKNSTANI